MTSETSENTIFVRFYFTLLSNANRPGHVSYQSHIGCLTKGSVRFNFELNAVNKHIDGLPVLSPQRKPRSLSHSHLN